MGCRAGGMCAMRDCCGERGRGGGAKGAGSEGGSGMLGWL